LSASYKNVVGTLVAIYFFISGILLIKSSAVIMGEVLAEKVVLIIRDTTSAVFAGWICTALLHSSGAFDSIIVAFTSSGVIPLTLSVAAIIGAEIGTTVTPFLISVLGHLRKGVKLTSSFNVTMSHVLYNLFTLILFYPIELYFRTFTKIAEQGSKIFVKASWLTAIPDILDVVTPWVDPLLEVIPTWIGLLTGGDL
jgi:sodium-dependent phosphate cotransporter